MRWLCVPCKVIRSRKFSVVQCSSELFLKSMDFSAPENVMFSALAYYLSSKHVKWNSDTETVNLRVIEINYIRLDSFYRKKNWFLDVPFCRPLCNVFIQPQIDPYPFPLYSILLLKSTIYFFSFFNFLYCFGCLVYGKIRLTSSFDNYSFFISNNSKFVF